MTQTAQIHELLNTQGKSGPTMTAALKSIGDGKMENGIQYMADYFYDSGNLIGNHQGWIKGSITTLVSVSIVIGSVYLKRKYDVYKAKKALAEKEKKIITAIKENATSEETLDEKQNKNII